MKKYLQAIFPSPAVTLSFFILPIVLTVYFVTTRYSEKFTVEQNITYLDVQNNLLGRFLISQQWLEWFNRFMDFAFWGILAALVLVFIWMFSSAKTAMQNHYAVEGFVNFKEQKESWHTHFFIVAAIKVVLVVVILVTLFIIVGQQIPTLATNITLLSDVFSTKAVMSVVYAGMSIVLSQFIIGICIKVFKHTRAA